MRAFFCGLLLLLVDSARISYKGQQVLRCSFNHSSTISILEDDLDVWGVLPGHLVEVRAKTPEERLKVESLTTDCQVIIPDLEQSVAEFEGLNLASRSRVDALWFENYHTYSEIYSWYQDFAKTYPLLVSFNESIGLSALGRQQPAIHIFNRDSTTNPNGRPSKRIYFQAQIHAREWISGATVNYIANQIATDYTLGDPFLRTLLNTVEIVIVPFVNPDGYEYTWTNDRLWRKNRRPIPGAICIGVDNNRNYNDHWGQGGSSNQTCSETFMGPTPASEPENQNTQNFYKRLQAEVAIHGAIDWHSYSQLILRPYGWTKTPSPDETTFAFVGQEMAAIIKDIDGRVYTSQPSIELYVTTGSASDWFYGDDATKGNQGYRTYSYTIELRPAQSPPGFELPPAEIIPTGIENYHAIRFYLDYVDKTPIVG